MKFSRKHALNAMIASLSGVLLFHTLVLVQVIPYTIVWAGKMDSVQQMIIFEVVSIIINSFLLLILLFKANYIKSNISTKFLNTVIWIFVIIFTLNTIGNLFSESKFELYFFTTLTLISTLLCLRIVRN